jgi:hypothetical protein
MLRWIFSIDNLLSLSNEYKQQGAEQLGHLVGNPKWIGATGELFLDDNEIVNLVLSRVCNIVPILWYSGTSCGFFICFQGRFS